MGFSVNDLLLAEELKDAKILGGKEGLDRQIKGVTIIDCLLYTSPSPRDA